MDSSKWFLPGVIYHRFMMKLIVVTNNTTAAVGIRTSNSKESKLPNASAAINLRIVNHECYKEVKLNREMFDIGKHIPIVYEEKLKIYKNLYFGGDGRERL